MPKAFLSTSYRIDWKPRGADDELYQAIETQYHEAQVAGVLRAKRHRHINEEFRAIKVQTIEEVTDL